MPALVVCGNRTFVAGDDLRTFTAFAIILRLIQILTCIRLNVALHGTITSNYSNIPEVCKHGNDGIETLIDASGTLFLSYFICAYITAIVGLLLEIGILMTSTKGTPVEQEKRARLKPLCQIKMIPMSVLRIGNMAMGVMVLKVLRHVCTCGGLALNPYAVCPRLNVIHGWIGLLIGSHFAEAAVVGLIGIYFFCKAGDRLPPFISAEAKWRCCCQCCCTVGSFMTCCLYGGRDGKTGDFADIALILADYFDDGGTIDVVPSDIVVGLRTLARVQQQKQSECRVELKRRASFIASLKKSTVNLDDVRARIKDYDIEEMGELDQGSPALRLVHFQQEGDTDEMVSARKNENQKSVEGKDVIDVKNDDGTWTGRISLKDDEELGGVTVVDESEVANMKSSLFDEDLEQEEELTAINMLEKEEEEEENDVHLTRIGSGKELRRRAVVFGLHRTAGGTLHFRPEVREVLSRKNFDDRLTIAEGARFMRFAMGIYLFRRYNTQSRSCEVCCAIGEKSKCFVDKAKECANKCRNKTNEMVPGHDYLDVRVGMGYRIGDILERRFLHQAGLDHTVEIKYVQFGEGVARTPYCISVDHAWKSIVVTIRGTEGFDDIVADLRMVPVSMAECGSRRGFNGAAYYCHAGMLACAEWIHEDLVSHGIVDHLLAEPRHAGYTLRLTGHSLGAGTAAILSFMIRHKYPNLKCSCFCPPGCTVSENMADECKDYLTSYVLDHDIVPRMSLTSLENLRNDMLDVIASLKVTKFQATHANQDVDKDMLLHRQNSIPSSKFKEQLEKFREQREEARTIRDVRSISLCPPGKIVQLVKTSADEPPAGCCNFRAAAAGSDVQSAPYAARWAYVTDFAEIIISSHFLDDHSSPNVLRELEGMAEVFGLSSPYHIQVTETPELSDHVVSLWRPHVNTR